MSSDGEQRTTSKSPLLSPFENAPKFTPPTSRKTSNRKPLHERSDSQGNRDSGPTIRLITDEEEPSADVYSKTPFPSQASQILPGHKRPGYAFESRGRRVSSAGYVANVVSKFEAGSSQVSPPLPQQPKAIRHSTSTTCSDADTIVAPLFTPSSETSRFSQGSTAPSSAYSEETGLEILEEETLVSEQPSIRAIPPSRDGPGPAGIRAVPPSRDGPAGIRAVPPSRDGPSEDHALTPRASAASLASSASADSFPTYRPTIREKGPSENIQTYPGSSDNGSTENILTYPESNNSSENISSPNIQTFPRHKKSTSFGSYRSFRNRAANRNRKLHARASSESFAYSSDGSPNYHTRSSSQPSPTSPVTHDGSRHITLGDGVRLQYPVVRAPSGSSIWAEPRILPKNPARMNPRTSHVHQWSSQLSTIPSESERASRSIDRLSQSIDGLSPASDERSPSVEAPSIIEYPRDGRSNIPRRHHTLTSISSEDNGNVSSESSVPVPLPLFSPVIKVPSEDRQSDELQDTVAELQSPPLRLKRSFLRRSDSDSAMSSRSISSRPSSGHSDFSTFISNTIPTWARVYYSRGSRITLGAPMSTTESTESLRPPTASSTNGRTHTPSESNFPLSIYRPRNRPHYNNNNNRLSNPDTISISEVDMDPVEVEEEEPQQVYVIGSHRRPLETPPTPRLRQDRRSQARLSAWKAPSFDDSSFFGRQNRQILLFCLGFIMPFAWMIASFLPLPPNPELSTPTPSQMDVERQFASAGIPPVEARAHRKALWWRNLNRIMAALGTLLIGVIIALAILADRMS